jgi:AraC family transcriptional regulator of adaptative response / DNA-3-methyladenine glycosylase II
VMRRRPGANPAGATNPGATTTDAPIVRPATSTGNAGRMSHDTAPVQLTVDLPVRQPFDAPGVFRFLAVRAIDGVEFADLTDAGRLRYARTLTLPHGPAAIDVAATHSARAGWQVSVRLELTSLTDIAPAVARVRRMLDLDADPVAVDAALAADPHLAPLVAHTPGIRVPGAVDPHELVIRALVGQQISVAAARTHLGRLAARAGSPYASAIAGLTRLFPTPSQILEHVPHPATVVTATTTTGSAPVRVVAPDPDRPLRLPAQSVRAILATALALDNGELEVHVGVDPEQLRARLVERPRIGPWTAAYIAMRVLGDPDAWLDGDVALVAGAKRTGILGPKTTASASHRELARRSAAWAPWRSYAAMHLWQAASEPKGTP